jgi:hypothetical protein
LSTTNQNNSPKSLEDSNNQVSANGIQSTIFTKGNIVDHLRHKVRVEAAAKYHPISPLTSPATVMKRRSSFSKHDTHDHHTNDLHSTSSRGSAHTHEHEDSHEESIENMGGHDTDDLEHHMDQDTLK